jgi:hypothetical protein
MFTKDELTQKRDEYRQIADQCKNDALANNGAAQAIDALINELDGKEEVKVT